MMRQCSVTLSVFDMGHQIGLRAQSEDRAIAFTVTPEVAERLIGDLQDALKQAAHIRHKHQLDREAGVYGPYTAKIL